MIITVGDYKYNARGKATYLANNALLDILRRYYWLYAPSGYYMPDGSVAIVESETETEYIDDIEVPKKIQRVLTEPERDAMLNRARANPDYIAECLDFHLIPIGSAPLISQLIETYDPTDEEKAEIDKAVLFFYANGIGSSLKKQESEKNTEVESPIKTEVTTHPDI